AEREWRASVDLKHHHAFSTLLTLSGRAYADYYGFESAFITSRGELCPFGMVTCNYANNARGVWGGLELQSSWDWTHTGDFVTVLGADVRERFVDTSSRAFDVVSGNDVYPTPRGLHVHDTIVGAYLQQTWRATRDLAFNGGARLDQDPRFPVVLTPRLAA